MIPFYLFQFDVVPANTADFLPAVWSVLSDPLVCSFSGWSGSYLLILTIIFVIRSMYHHHGRASVAFDMKVCFVKVLKELKKEDADQEKSTQQIQEAIGHMETVCGAVGLPLTAERGMGAWFFGRKDAFSFEIVYPRGQDFVLRGGAVQVARVYRRADPRAIFQRGNRRKPFRSLSPNGVILGSYLTFRRPSYFPIKTYNKMETDSINSLTNALAKIEAGDGACIQYVVRSAKRNWRIEGTRIAKAMPTRQEAERRDGEGHDAIVREGCGEVHFVIEA